MGSIPTRPRHPLWVPAALLALLAVLVGTAPALAQDAAQDSASAGRSNGAGSPFWVMMRSAVVPGWGQMHNGNWLKALVLGGTESAFLYGIYQENRLADSAARNSRERPEEASYWEAESDRHRARKKDYLWWGAFTLLLSVGDAYVDAHLKGFDLEFRTEETELVLSFEVVP